MQKKSPLYALLKEGTVWSMDHLNSHINDKFRKAKGLPRDWVFTTFTVRPQLNPLLLWGKAGCSGRELCVSTRAELGTRLVMGPRGLCALHCVCMCVRSDASKLLTAVATAQQPPAAQAEAPQRGPPAGCPRGWVTAAHLQAHDQGGSR